ncbi:MAG: hypothetical protein WBQ25_24320 [Nitrososphaeraceae archaeon]
MAKTCNIGKALYLAILLIGGAVVTLTSVLTIDTIAAKKSQTLKQLPSQSRFDTRKGRPGNR